MEFTKAAQIGPHVLINPISGGHEGTISIQLNFVVEKYMQCSGDILIGPI